MASKVPASGAARFDDRKVAALRQQKTEPWIKETFDTLRGAFPMQDLLVFLAAWVVSAD